MTGRRRSEPLQIPPMCLCPRRRAKAIARHHFLRDGFAKFAAPFIATALRCSALATPTTPLGKVSTAERISSQKLEISGHPQRITPTLPRLRLLAILCYRCLYFVNSCGIRRITIFVLSTLFSASFRSPLGSSDCGLFGGGRLVGNGGGEARCKTVQLNVEF
jgi:hypothetical protein